MSAALSWSVPPAAPARAAAVGVALWAFIAVAGTLFALCILAYVMRMGSDDWADLALPWQLGLSTGLLLAGSIALQAAAGAARAGAFLPARRELLIGGACALAFVVVQAWAWQALLALQVRPAGNPAASFFYLLTALHALHVLGGLVGWTLTLHGLARQPWRAALCARYWHFLLLAWLVLLATFAGLTPPVVRFICGF
ncbi:bb3-type cytochrome oxidase subunit III [Azohydromonas caseinilytica]|uniref:Bb3-type cytochrome oxidase subunit III n=1 Tax=Azohydromonas caseinilytica TaxID=2728836 RepID=A0A848FCE0_9BURK|nr:bb3-type cytochrome oxidase subunit III [Azohydromonas caseinilytica]NML16435.1 bb3-type cytochrome oxidase subunit III [Azohydromonas caseinilytica]